MRTNGDGRPRSRRTFFSARVAIATAAVLLGVVALLMSRAPRTSAQGAICTAPFEFGCAFGLPYPINSSQAAANIGLTVLQSCYTGGYCPAPVPSPTPVACIPISAAGHYQAQPDGSQLWVANTTPPGSHLCVSTPTPTPSS